MNDKTAKDWGNYWQGRAASEAGAALVGVGIETDAEISDFWAQRLGTFPKDAKILDLACGAGSVTRRAAVLGLTDVTGLDISEDAIATLKAEFPDVTGIVASADETGLPRDSFDVVASQFGFEYADAPKAAAEAARLLKTGGQFIALAHSQGSAIDAEVSRHERAANAVLESGFFAAAIDMFRADMSGASDAVFHKAAQAFSGPQAEVLTIAKGQGGLAAYLYQGTQKLFEQRRNYVLPDVVGWLEGMQGEITAYAGRMESMRRAALSRRDAEAVMHTLEAGGLIPQPLEQFTSKNSGDVIGWIISALEKA